MMPPSCIVDGREAERLHFAVGTCRDPVGRLRISEYEHAHHVTIDEGQPRSIAGPPYPVGCGLQPDQRLDIIVHTAAESPHGGKWTMERCQAMGGAPVFTEDESMRAGLGVCVGGHPLMNDHLNLPAVAPYVVGAAAPAGLSSSLWRP